MQHVSSATPASHGTAHASPAPAFPPQSPSRAQVTINAATFLILNFTDHYTSSRALKHRSLGPTPSLTSSPALLVWVPHCDVLRHPRHLAGLD